MKSKNYVIVILACLCVALLFALVFFTWAQNADPKLIGLFRSGIVTRTGLVGGIALSIDGANWTAIAADIPLSVVTDPLHARVEITGAGYSGAVSITWKLIDESTGVELYSLPLFTSVTLSGAAGQIIYAEPNGTLAPGFDFGTHAATPSNYYVQAEIYA